ncbi:GGDEF domain-containing protein [Chromobacterium alkanivorans]|uniref:GGDEF domain-containing protein n=1 Tax=Chromobacterium TaxID=535 RepID=UPI000653F257|nr:MULTISPECIES: GGDEF domain-containing protein [Chromobacterium]KMN82294.1 diguanylate cyclase [Chromobacterium sp. LK11]MBN3003689.1 GGDEF domain-containing protein [Chromobacterium alkanivorans]
MHITHFIWQKLLGMAPGEIQSGDTLWLLSPRQHMPLLAQRRALMLVNRCRLFAILFSALTPAWAVIDLLTLPYPLSLQLAGLRLLVSAAFVALAVWQPMDGRLSSAYRGIALLFAIPTLFYIASHLLLRRYHLEGLSAAIGAGYAFLPFVLLAGLAIFPLTLLESLAFASPALFGFLLTGLLELNGDNLPGFGGEFWLLSLLTGVSAIAGISQLAFIIVLVHQAIRDPLTGVFSRRSGEEMLGLLQLQAQRSRQPLSLAFIDLDHFKTINDHYGHLAGDQVLRHFAELMEGRLRRSDVLVRWGGEEFVLLMPGAQLPQAAQVIARLRAQGLGERPEGKVLTASIGVAELFQDGCADWRALVDLADTRMYRAKQAGRNRVMISD